MKDYENKIKEYLKERGWHQLRPGDLAKSISIEAAELLEIFQWYNPAMEEFKKDKARFKLVKKELADVMNYCFDLAVTLEIDVEQMLDEKLAHVKKKYPARLMKDTKGKDPGTDESYLKIKNKYRRKGL